jgi:AAA+ ATPase superfamily predicted ATPase
MEDHVLAYKAPLYGRKTAQLKIQPFGFLEARGCLKKLPAADMALAYGIAGGTPQYLLQLDDSLPIADNIKNTFLNPASPLFEEPANLLRQEVREPAIYNAIIAAIAAGASRLSEVSGRVGEDTSACASYIKNLISLGIVKKETPYGESSARKTIYSIADNMFRFWYRFVPENNSAIARGAADIAYRRIEPHLPAYMGAVFEEICKQHLWRLLLRNEAAVNFTDIGHWWGANPKTRQQAEIDIVGAAGKDAALFGECKWTNEKVDRGALETLVERSNLLGYRDRHYYMFAKTGFTKGCEDRSRELGNVSLVTYADIAPAFCYDC